MCIFTQNDPYTMLRESAQLKKGNERYEGFALDLLDALAEKLHFSYEIHPVKDGKYGRQDSKTGEWDGMIGEVVNGVRNHFDYLSRYAVYNHN